MKVFPLSAMNDDLEKQVKERTAEFVSANERLEVEVRERAQAEERLRALWKTAEMVDAEDRQLYDHILQGALRMTRSKYAFYGFMNADQSVMSNYAWSQEVHRECRTSENIIEFPIAKAGIWAEAVRRRQVLLLNDYQADHPGKLGLPEGHVPLTRILVVPVFSHGSIVAVVAVANKAEDYQEGDVRQLEAFVTGVQVIIDQRKAERQLRESESKYSALVENSLTGIYIVVDGDIIFANNRFAEIHGYSREEVIGMKSWMIIHPEAREFFDEIRRKRSRGEEVPLSYEIKGIKKGGETVWTNRSNITIEYGGKPAILGNVADITQRRQAEEALRASERECRLLSRQVIEAQENERKRFARDIHDGIGQSLAAIKYRVEGYSRLAKDENSEKAKELKSIVEMIQTSMDEVRRIQNDLRPAFLDEFGVIATITGFCEGFQATYSDIKITMNMDIPESEVPEYLKAPIYRIFQESMNNAARHSDASQIDIRFLRTGNRIELIVEDNGVGFAASHRPSGNAHGTGLGLYSMGERTELSGGTLEIKSTPGKGTTIKATWPVKEDK
jgi:PAS domain S-box-containing protein